MKIDNDVQLTARRFGIDPALIQAVVNAEGDILKTVRCSLPETPDRAKALDIACRSAVHAMSDFIKADSAETFVAFWSRRWAPDGADNDPTHLNQFWPSNVLNLWTKA
jgi:hypothetical protein